MLSLPDKRWHSIVETVQYLHTSSELDQADFSTPFAEWVSRMAFRGSQSVLNPSTIENYREGHCVPEPTMSFSSRKACVKRQVTA